MIESGAIQPPDPIPAQRIPARGERGGHSALANMPDDLVDVRMPQRLAAQRHDAVCRGQAAARFGETHA
jgi:hypothetical protein